MIIPFMLETKGIHTFDCSLKYNTKINMSSTLSIVKVQLVIDTSDKYKTNFTLPVMIELRYSLLPLTSISLEILVVLELERGKTQFIMG